MTDRLQEEAAAPVISTHTPAWGVTYYLVADKIADSNFNSHARVGRDVWMQLMR